MKAALLLSLLVAQDPAVLSERAQRLARQKELGQAEQLWKQALDVSPRYFPALFNLGFLCYSQQRYADAAGYLERAAKEDARDFNTRYLLGAAYSKLEKREDALRQWQAALELQPRNLRLMQIMVVEYEKGRYFNDEAALARRALELKQDDPNLYFLAIKASQDAGDYAAALEVAGQAAARFPSSARANFEYGFHLQKVGKIAEAMTYLEKAMAADPSYEEPPFFYGDLLLNQGKPEAAIPYLRKAIRNRNDYVPARVTLARALMNLRRWKEAIAELEETVRLDPRHPQPHLLLSQIYFRLGDEARAKQEKEISMRLRRENPTALEAVQGRPFPGR